MAERLCPRCKRWEVHPDDLYCGLCGNLLLSVSVQPQELVLLAGLNPARRLVLSNDGPRPVELRFRLEGGKAVSWLLVEEAPVRVEAGKKASVKVSLAEGLLPEDLTVRTFGLRCEIDGDSRKALPVRVTVKSGPKPELVAPEIRFGSIAEGKSATKAIQIRNRGGLPFKIKEVLPEGSGQLSVEVPPGAFPLRGDPESPPVAIPVTWDTSREEGADTDPEKRGFRILFENDLPDLFAAARAWTYKQDLVPDPKKIEIKPAFQKHRFFRKIDLENRGTVDLVIRSIEVDQPWVKLLTEPTAFNLLAREAESNPEQTSTTADPALPKVTGLYTLYLMLTPENLPAGPHQAKLTIRGNDRELLREIPVELEVLEPQEYDDHIGIDFGTTNSVICFRHPVTQELSLVEDAELGTEKIPWLIPSVLVFTRSTEQYVIGREARRQMAVYPENTVRSVKRLLGSGTEHEFFGKMITTSDVAKLLMQRLIELTEVSIHRETGVYYKIQRAIVTVPANFYDRQIRGILNACEGAGLWIEDTSVGYEGNGSGNAGTSAEGREIILDEPAAAALLYVNHLEKAGATADLQGKIRDEKGMHLLVYDHGGGTLDVSVAQIRQREDEQFELTVKSTAGDNTVGGESIDLKIMDFLLKRVSQMVEGFDASLISIPYSELKTRQEKEQWSGITFSDVLSARILWKDMAEAVKIDLSELKSTEVHLEGGALIRVEDGDIIEIPQPKAKVEISRDDIEKLIQDALVRAAEVVQTALDTAGVEASDLDYVFHTGRQSLMPAVREGLRSVLTEFPLTRHIVDQDLLKVCVAKGAALYGWVTTTEPGQGRPIFVNEGRRFPHSYGLMVRKGIASEAFHPLIPQGTTYPAHAELPLTMGRRLPGGEVLFRIFEEKNQSGKNGKSSKFLGQVKVSMKNRDQEAWDARLVVDNNRRLEIHALGQQFQIEPDDALETEDWLW